ncbi:MAG: MOSC domain-containing protein [Gammaproteobacteria bacterium]|nr:MOSC domain-containing protein [Gammaproteobacteria bacterium]MDH3415226.1 MOSC domain-containing protein [Gammaproteobacteria bacterium]
MATSRQLSKEELAQGLDIVSQSPKGEGVLQLIVRRPDVDQRESVAKGHLDIREGLVGDSWRARGSGHMPDGQADPDMQLNIMNSRVAELVANGLERRELAGDQLYLDMDLSRENLPPGTQLALGEAIIEVTEPPHTGCKKFAARFGTEAMVFVNSGMGKTRNFRGICAKVVQSGDIRVGDVARKV